MRRSSGNLQTTYSLRHVGTGIKTVARAGAIGVLCILLVNVSTTAASAQGNVPRQLTPARLSLVDGAVSFWRPGAQDWVPAQLNTPLEAGDELYNERGANAEVQFGPEEWARSGTDTEMGLDEEDPDYVQFKVTAGETALDLRNLPAGQTVEVATPSAAVTIGTAGYYRVDVRDKATTVTARRGGQAAVVPTGGNEVDLSSNQEVVIGLAATAAAEPQPAPPLDEWDGWNFGRTDMLLQARSDPYVSQAVYGGADLGRYGHWRQVAPYGPVWVPADVRPGWSPYSDGHWVLDPYYGWTWIDDAPWGWAPFHYGRWVHIQDYWGWCPGPFVAAPAYAPALVAFFDIGPDIQIGIGTPALGWVPLGWGEPCIPWWGRRGFVGHPWWGGWHGPRVVNEQVISRMTVVRADQIRVYRNAAVRDAIIAAPRTHFFNGERHVVRFDSSHGVRRADMRLVRGELPIHPSAAALVPEGRGRGHAPPATVQNRPVVATRRPREPIQRLQVAGLHVPSGTMAPAPRIVEPTHPSEPPQRGAVPTMHQLSPPNRALPDGRAEEARHVAQLPNETSQTRVEQGRPAGQPLQRRERPANAAVQAPPRALPGVSHRAEIGSEVPPPAPARPERSMRMEVPQTPPAQLAHARPKQEALAPSSRTRTTREVQVPRRESAPRQQAFQAPREERRPAFQRQESSPPPMTGRRSAGLRAPERPQVEPSYHVQRVAPAPRVERAPVAHAFRSAPERTPAPHQSEPHAERAEHRK
jgi:hypothetical protein